MRYPGTCSLFLTLEPKFGPKQTADPFFFISESTTINYWDSR